MHRVDKAGCRAMPQTAMYDSMAPDSSSSSNSGSLSMFALLHPPVPAKRMMQFD
jgi:hypothetical protein